MRHDGVAVSQPPSRVFGSTTWPDIARSYPAPPVRILRGRDAVLAMQPALIELSHHTGQSGAMDWLDHFLASPDSVKKTPYLLLTHSEEESAARCMGLQPHSISAGDLLGAVLLYEYRLGRFGTRIFATDDTNGVRSVIAPCADRLAVANATVRRLMRSGTVAALVTFSGDCGPQRRYAGIRAHTATRVRTVPHHLILADSFDATLAPLGHRTRRNLRYYRRRVEADLGAEFVPEVRISREEFFACNRAATHPFADRFAAWRYSLLEHACGRDILFAGLRDREGRWLSLIGGRRNGDTPRSTGR